MKKLFMNKAGALLFVSALFLSSQAVQAESYRAADLIVKADGMMEVMDKLSADKKQGNAVNQYFALLKSMAESMGNSAKKPLFWHIELLEKSPGKALDTKEYGMARREFAQQLSQDRRKYSKLDSTLYQWGDTLGQILVQFYGKHLGDKEQSEKVLKRLLQYYPQLSINIEKLSN